MMVLDTVTETIFFFFNEQLQKQIRHTTHSERYIYTQYTLYHEVDAKIQILYMSVQLQVFPCLPLI